MSKNIIFLSFLVLPLYMSIAQEGAKWNLRKQSNSIEIYTRSVEGSSYKEFKAVMTLDSLDLEEIVSPLMNVNCYSSLFPYVDESQVLKKYGSDHKILYCNLDLPWPFNDRDVVYEQYFTYNPKEQTIYIEMKCVKNWKAKSNGVVRILSSRGYWQIKRISGGNYEIIYQFHTELEGNIPSWLANSMVVDYPYRTMKNLLTLIQNGKKDCGDLEELVQHNL